MPSRYLCSLEWVLSLLLRVRSRFVPVCSGVWAAVEVGLWNTDANADALLWWEDICWAAFSAIAAWRVTLRVADTPAFIAEVAASVGFVCLRVLRSVVCLQTSELPLAFAWVAAGFVFVRCGAALGAALPVSVPAELEGTFGSLSAVEEKPLVESLGLAGVLPGLVCALTLESARAVVWLRLCCGAASKFGCEGGEGCEAKSRPLGFARLGELVVSLRASSANCIALSSGVCKEAGE